MPVDQIQAGGEQANAVVDEAALRAHMEEDVEEAGRRMKRQWREHPIAIVTAALGVGLLLGALIGRSR